MHLRLKLTAFFASAIVASGATTTERVVKKNKPSNDKITDAADTAAAADTDTNRELYGAAKVINRRQCPEEDWCQTAEDCFNSEMADVHGVNGIAPQNNCVVGCILKLGGKVSWFPKHSNLDHTTIKNCANENIERVCCPPRDTPTASPTWMDDSWGKADTWGGGNKWGGDPWSKPQWSNNKWGGGNKWNNNQWGIGDWGGWEP